MPTNFDDFVREVEDQSTPEELHALHAAYARFQLGARLHDHRVAAGLTQEALAEMTGVDQGDISRIERGQCNPTLEKLAALGGPLGMHLDYVDEHEPVSA
jgi:DNA-binding XRE family transcriptional regulator